MRDSQWTRPRAYPGFLEVVINPTHMPRCGSNSGRRAATDGGVEGPRVRGVDGSSTCQDFPQLPETRRVYCSESTLIG